MSLSLIGKNTCDNDRTHETCELCGNCPSCNEFDEAAKFTLDEVLELIDMTPDCFENLNKSEIRGIIKETLEKRVSAHINFENLPIAPVAGSFFEKYITHEIRLASQGTSASIIFKNQEGQEVNFDTAFREYLISKVEDNPEAVRALFYVEEPEFLDNYKEETTSYLLEAVLAIKYQIKEQKSTLFDDIQNMIPGTIKVSRERFDQYIKNMDGHFDYPSKSLSMEDKAFIAAAFVLSYKQDKNIEKALLAYSADSVES